MNTKHIGISNSDKLAFFSNFSTMLSAGIPILETVNSLLEDAKGNQKKFLEELRDDLKQGKRIHDTFDKFPKIFDKVTINIINAAEQAGTLDITLKDLKEKIKKEMEFNDKIRAALIYPFILLVLFSSVMLIILLFVVPKLASIFTRMDVPLPLPTKILFFLSSTLIDHTITVVVGSGIIIAGIVIFYKTQKHFIVSVFTSLPFIKGLARDIDLTRFTQSLSLLLSAGITIIQALELTESVVIRKEIANLISHSQQKILAGEKLSNGLKDARAIVPTIIIKMTEAGEKSGSLEKTMQEASEYLNARVTIRLQALTILIEPIMLVLAGVVIGGMMLSLFAPIYGLIGSIGG